MPINIVQVNSLIISPKKKQKRNITPAEAVIKDSLFTNNEEKKQKSILQERLPQEI